MLDWLVLIRDSWLQTLGWLTGLAACFTILVRLMPCNPGMYWWKDLRAVATDFMYWFVVPLFLRLAQMMMLIAGVALLFGGRAPNLLPVRHLPLWLQAGTILLLQDVMLYWIHRLFHTRRAWKFHAIHHSPTVLDWMSTARFHPINHLLSFTLADVVVLLLGFDPEALAILMPINIVYSSLVHANLNWTFGPLRYFFASPVFHRWHHTTQEEGLDKNFASTFPFLDVIFGTFWMPPGKLPERFGTGDPEFPADFWGQFFHPLRSRLAAVLAGGGLAAVVLLVGGLYLVGWRMQRDEQLARQAQVHEAALREARAAEGRPAVRFDLKRGFPVLGVALSADGRRLAVAGQDGSVTVWDTATGEQTHSLTGHTRAVRCVAISNDGKLIVSGGFDRTLTLWDAEARQDRVTLKGQSAFISVAVSGDGKHIVSGSADGAVKVWDAQGKEKGVLARDTSAATSVAIGADGNSVVWASGQVVKVWDVRAGREKFTLQGHTKLVYAVAISPDGGRIVSGGFDNRVTIWDGATGQLISTLRGHRGPVYSVSISGDGRTVISGSADGTVMVWDAVSGCENYTLAGHTDSIMSAAISGDGNRIVSGSQDGAIKVWYAPGLELQRRTARSGRPHPPDLP